MKGPSAQELTGDTNAHVAWFTDDGQVTQGRSSGGLGPGTGLDAVRKRVLGASD
jgi:hypothetical protein